jgi:hypothetical protein
VLSEATHGERLQRAGFVLHQAAEGLRDVRVVFPAQDDLARRLRALEEEARTIAGEIAMELLELEEKIGGRGGWKLP